MTNDGKIITGCKKGKHRHQMALFDKYAPMLRGVCLRYVNNNADADDLLQEGFIKILDNIKNYAEQGSFIAWMKRIMINNALNYCRKNSKIHFTELEDGFIDYTEHDESSDKLNNKVLDADLSADNIIEIFNKLPEGYKMVLNLYVLDGYSHAEIAEKLGISVNTSKSQLSRARKALIKKTEEILNKTNSKEQITVNI
ncbi:MAG: hypothetical protein C0596_09730 [Marinilabiliales bacterium]|nr:MAG: hypothetical protein C0596_09730 [Marinilabiliales bacterium]